ncbi:MAG: hypothetical protein II346_07025 [Ruminococcus sp.]|nr:hypothetical protein [Ruminococcus sp.]
MIDFNAVKGYYPFDIPDYFEPLAATFVYDPSLPLVSEEEMTAVEQATGVDAACFAFLRELNAKLFADPARNLAARFLRYVLFEARKPWENHLYIPVMFEVPGYEAGSVHLLFVTAALGYTLTVRKPPADLNAENVGAYRGYTTGYTNEHGHWGIGELHWNLLCAGGCMFLFNTLKFQPSTFSSDYLAITDGKQYRTLCIGTFGVDKNGALTSDESRVAFRTASLVETDDAFVAHEVFPNGAVDEKTTSFDKKTWKVALCEKDFVLGIHIPSKSEYTPEQHRASILQALEFYRAFYPDMEFKAITCWSWLYSAQNKHIFSADSRILEIERCVHLCPIVATMDENLMFIRPGSSLQQRMADFRAAGNEYHAGFMYSPLSEAEVFGEYRHEL